MKADPRPTFIWTCEGQEVKSSSKFSISIKEESGIYIIRLEISVSCLSDTYVDDSEKKSLMNINDLIVSGSTTRGQWVV